MASNFPEQSNKFHSTPIRGNPPRGEKEWRSRLELDPKRKHLSSPELLYNNCAKCDNELDEYKIDCKGCKLNFCARCSGLNSAVIGLILSGALEDYDFHCKCCKQTKPTLESIDRNLKELNQRQEIRLTTLEEKVKRIDLTVKDTVKNEVQEAKNQIMEDIKSTITQAVDNRTKEMEDRRRRELNIVVFNLPEGKNENGQLNKQYDENNVRTIAEKLGLDTYLQIETSYRLGKKNRNQAKERVLKIILQDRKQRKFLLENSRRIKEIAEEIFKRVVLFKDLTLDQRDERKRKRENKENTNIILQPPLESLRDISQILSQQPINPFIQDTIMETEHHINVMSEEKSEITENTIIGGIRIEDQLQQENLTHQAGGSQQVDP